MTFGSLRCSRPTLIWVAGTLGVVAVFGRLAVHNLGNYRPLSNDEGELMSVGYKLATQGVLGSDMFAGFFGADRHYLLTLPLQAVLQALSFRVFGAGVLQARLVSLLAAIALVWTVGWVAFRWYGVATALLTEVLLVGWRSNLTSASNGLPLLGVARTARYDVLAVTAAWLTIAAIELARRRPSPSRGLLTGVCAGVAALSQFFGVFVLPLVVVFGRPRRWIVPGFALTITPFVVFLFVNRADLSGQAATYGDRASFSLQKLGAEVERYRDLLGPWPPVLDVTGPDVSDSPLSPWLMAIGIVPAAAYVAYRRQFGDRLLFASLVCFAGLLALLDTTRTPLYAILLLPSVCMCIAVGFVALLRVHLISRVAVAICLSVMLLEGLHAYVVDWQQAATVTPYVPLGSEIDAAIPASATVLGPERWWWALHSHPYLSLRSTWYQWTAQSSSGGSPQFSDWVHAQSIVVNVNVRADIQAFPAPLQEQFWSFVAHCTTRVAAIPNPNYFETEIYSVTPGCS